jgi:hypothetical protein
MPLSLPNWSAYFLRTAVRLVSAQMTSLPLPLSLLGAADGVSSEPHAARAEAEAAAPSATLGFLLSFL